ncbi:DUF948 domain-containing protein [Niallia endozanthoxylica]|uniref:DUF948 domain-containing protein n=1 Tax=Niallia endozanthoxylica TaxID=2036016 RepID=A0A5J5HWV2_9BACI|nr:DUF948 domain-containing protein [Niallia endozanthoxylica]KAA9027461.1 DUF948 domain-containing protein [Niallia endozanthoxylica]
MIIILYISTAVIAIAFFILVIYLSRTLKSLQGTLDNVSKTLSGLEQQLEGVTKETTILLHKTNELASDVQKKAEDLNSVVHAVKDVGESVRKFSGSIQSITNSMNKQVEDNKDKIAQVVQWSNVILELKDKWQGRKQRKNTERSLEEGYDFKKERARY